MEVSMERRLVAAATALILVGAGCSEQQGLKERTGRITVDGNTASTQAVSCTQIELVMVIETTAGPGHVRSFLQLGGQSPIAETVNIDDFQGFSGVAGEGVGRVQVSSADSTYTITGTAEGSDPVNPGKMRTAAFTIEAPC
jgi:lipoprotein LpqH